jgi:hypothetical protein
LSINQSLINKIQAFLDQTLVIKAKKDKPHIKSTKSEVSIYKFLDTDVIESPEKQKIDEFIKKHRLKGFRDLLFKYIDDQNKKDSEVYKKALLDRRLFSKIRSDEAYHPNKKTVISFILALKLDLNQALTLLKAAGYTLSESSVFDLIIVYCINNQFYEVLEVNEILEHFKLKPLGQID